MHKKWHIYGTSMESSFIMGPWGQSTSHQLCFLMQDPMRQKHGNAAGNAFLKGRAQPQTSSKQDTKQVCIRRLRWPPPGINITTILLYSISAVGFVSGRASISNCTFCFSHKFYEKSQRKHSVVSSGNKWRLLLFMWMLIKIKWSCDQNMSLI